MTDSNRLLTLAHWLAGEFENSAQAFDNPAWFVNLRLWQRPLPQRWQGQLALFAEQANALYLQQAYRQRLLVLQQLGEQIQVQYWAFKQPEQLRGAGANPSLLAGLSPGDLELLPGCVLSVSERDGKFYAEPPPAAQCYFQYQGEQRQVILGFEVSAGQFWSHDRGVEPETGKVLWGAMLGPYQFVKCQDYARELPPA